MSPYVCTVVWTNNLNLSANILIIRSVHRYLLPAKEKACLELCLVWTPGHLVAMVYVGCYKKIKCQVSAEHHVQTQFLTIQYCVAYYLIMLNDCHYEIVTWITGLVFQVELLPTILILVVYIHIVVMVCSGALCIISCHQNSQLALKSITKGCVNLLIHRSRIVTSLV